MIEKLLNVFVVMESYYSNFSFKSPYTFSIDKITLGNYEPSLTI